MSDYGVSEGGPARQTDRQTSPGSGSPVTCLQAAAGGSARMIRPPRYLTPLRSPRHSLPCPVRSGAASMPCNPSLRDFRAREREKLTPSGPRRSCRPSESKGAAAAAAAGQHANDPVGRGHAVGVARRFFLQSGPGWTPKDAPCGGCSVGGQDAHQKRGAQGAANQCSCTSPPTYMRTTDSVPCETKNMHSCDPPASSESWSCMYVTLTQPQT